MTKKVLIFGASKDGIELARSLTTLGKIVEVDLVGFADNDSRLHGKKILGKKVIDPVEIPNIEFDICIICPIFHEEITRQLEELNISKEKIQLLIDEELFSEKNRYIRGNKIGRYSYFKPSTQIMNTTIGNFCHIGDNCIIGLIGHDPKCASTYPMNHHFTQKQIDISKDQTASESRKGTVEIGNDVYIGEGVSIFGNLKIGDGAIIASRSVVTKNVAPYSVVAGIPGKPIKMRFSDEIIKELMDMKWWDWPDQKIEKYVNYFGADPIDLIEAVKKDDEFNVNKTNQRQISEDRTFNEYQ